MDWINSIEHGRMVAHKVDNLIWVIFSRLHVGGKRPSWTLWLEGWHKMYFSFLDLQTWMIIILNVTCNTYCSWSGVRDFTLVGNPLVVWPFLVSERAVKDHADISHWIHTHCWTFKYRPRDAERKRDWCVETKTEGPNHTGLENAKLEVFSIVKIVFDPTVCHCTGVKMSWECTVSQISTNTERERTRDRGTDRAVKSLAVDGESLHYYHQEWCFWV